MTHIPEQPVEQVADQPAAHEQYDIMPPDALPSFLDRARDFARRRVVRAVLVGGVALGLTGCSVGEEQPEVMNVPEYVVDGGVDAWPNLEQPSDTLGYGSGYINASTISYQIKHEADLAKYSAQASSSESVDPYVSLQNIDPATGKEARDDGLPRTESAPS